MFNVAASSSTNSKIIVSCIIYRIDVSILVNCFTLYEQIDASQFLIIVWHGFTGITDLHASDCVSNICSMSRLLGHYWYETTDPVKNHTFIFSDAVETALCPNRNVCMLL
jgi:hypothetical protein